MKGTSLGTGVAGILGACVLLAGFPGITAARQVGQDDETRRSLLTSSAYPPVSSDLSKLWLVPNRAAKARVPRVLVQFAEGVRLQADEKYRLALPLLTARGLAGTPLADYASYFKGVTLLRLGKLDEAQRAFDDLRAREPAGYLSEAARLRAAETAEARGDYPAAIQIYEELATERTVAPDSVLTALAKASLAAGDRQRAARAYVRLYYDYPLSDLSMVAGAELDGLGDVVSMEPAVRYKMDVARAGRLFDAKRYAAAEPAFQALLAQASGDDRELFSLRVAECQFYLRRQRLARDGVQPFIEQGSRKAEARFFYLSSVRELGDQDEYVRLARQLVSEFGASSWAEEALNNLASHFIVNNDDEQADQVFRELYARFPKGKYAERAAWKTGWWAYKHSRYNETVRLFEEAAANFPHSDYRPSYLYWSARAHEALGERELADARYRLVLTDYRNTYYGRMTVARFGERREGVPQIDPVAIVETPPSEVNLPANAQQIRLLLALGLNDQAMDELQYAQRTWGDSPLVAATIAWVHNQSGDLRSGITLMKRAYPQHMAAGGEKLPVEIRKVMYPIDYWPAIKRQAASRRVDPYLIASLILQESNFSPSARSSANAIGLMQLLPSTGRRYARSLRIRGFSPRMLTRPDTNLRLGVAYFSDLMKRFGSEYLALASYNAGEHRVAQWIAERPGLAREEFIDDIPFPETQNFVKRILAGVEHYRSLYGEPAPASKAKATSPKPAAKKKSAKTKA